MFGIHLFTPKCLVEEKLHFKYSHYIYLTKHFNTGIIEMWCRSHKNPYLPEIGRECFLGMFVLGKWEQSPGLGNLEWTMQRGAQRLHKVCIDKFGSKEEKKYDSTMEKKKVVYDRAYFVEQGKKGQQKVKEKYQKSSVELRWKGHTKLSTEKVADE